MARRSSRNLTERESQIMEVLWAMGRGRAEQVRAALPGQPHDSTVRTLLRVLESKGYVRRDVRQRAHVYRPTLPRAKARQGALRSLLARFFGGSPEALVLQMLTDEQITPEQLDALRRSEAESGPQEQDR